MQELVLLVGNVGCGKSFLAKRLAKRGAIVVNNDNLLQMYHGEYTYDSDLREFYHEVEDVTIKQALKSGRSVVIDRTNIDEKSRKRFIDIGHIHGVKITSFDFGPGQDMQLQRRLNDPKGQTIDTWRSVYNMMHMKYKKPSSEEGIDGVYTAPTEFRFWAFDFDGTITMENVFPKIAEPRQIVVDKMHELSKDLSNIIIIWSCRSDDFENQMKEWLDDRSIPYDFLNENPIFNIGTRKIFANIYIDDRAGWISDDGKLQKYIDNHIHMINYDEAVKKVENGGTV